MIAIVVALGIAATLAAAPRLAAQSLQYRAPDGTEFRALADTGPVARARAALAGEPRSVARIIALATAQSSARQYREAIATLGAGIAAMPDEVLLYRWRGHRSITVRDFATARADLARGLALDSTNYGVLFHLGVMHYLDGRFDDAAALFARAQPRAPDGGERAGSTDWRWLSLARAGRRAEGDAMLARRPDSLPVPPTYAYVKRLALYRGETTPEQLIATGDTADVQRATLLYGLGTWQLVRGDTASALAAYRQAVATGGWPGFGFIAAEIELARLTRTPASRGVGTDAPPPRRAPTRAERAAARDSAAALALFRENIDAIHTRDHPRYLRTYLQTPGLTIGGLRGLTRGWAAWPARTDGAPQWPDTLIATELRVAPVAPGVVYGVYRYRGVVKGRASVGISERLFVRTPQGWRIGYSASYPDTLPP
ncbi:MAG: hypothetical protein MUF21_11935 [Gemmatimonadaceae bacterium]|nr:hypothetical protein [Gemmatimonadaceae bacterium]